MTAEKAEKPVRRRDADATRRSLVEAAAELFAERGYDRTTVRAIAARAGVNQALLFRYFGSKTALFGEVVAMDGRRQLRETPAERLLETALRNLLAPAGDAPPGDRSLEVFLRSVGGDDEAARTSRRLTEEYTGVLAGLTRAEDAELRSALVLAWLLGIGLTRVVVRQEPLAGADPEHVCRLMLTAARTLLEHLPVE
ncbi:TetR/AcrR family transcriptional regulator [Streptomyces cinnamoneus]|uniref:TetR family transcriptional regulator n=1 Tax=Streptomyces cinnamoneus TaxID=53446 RepID=A0A918WEQ7_STRCJ|nr:TetR/AcrR family transcriptional regulator [Streptomyces cinnamoneus]GHC40910.1 TetR family transcriptional regulator [Streptomyces cinnamoneus]